MAGNPHLVVVAYAVAPGPGGPEGHVNTRLIEALTEHWRGPVTVISGGDRPPSPNDHAPVPMAGWEFRSLGEAGEYSIRSSLLNRLALRARRDAAEKSRRALLPRLVNRLLCWTTGDGLKMASWTQSASRALGDVLLRHPQAVVYSRALPYASIAAVARVRRRLPFTWIVNVNDPLPADVWPGLYQTDPRSNRLIRRRFRNVISSIDAFTFPCRQLRELETAAFPAMSRVPNLILPHITRLPSAAQPSQANADKLVIAFSGTLRKTRICPALAKALSSLRAQDPEALDRITFMFHLARPNPSGEEFVRGLPCETHVQLGEFDEALESALGRADVLLDLETVADKPLMLTKVCNYVGFGKPIWSICAPGGTAWNLVHDHGCGYAADVREPASILSALKTILADWCSGRLAERGPSSQVVDRFCGRRAVADLAALCDWLAASRDGQPAPDAMAPASETWP